MVVEEPLELSDCTLLRRPLGQHSKPTVHVRILPWSNALVALGPAGTNYQEWFFRQ